MHNKTIGGILSYIIAEKNIMDYNLYRRRATTRRRAARRGGIGSVPYIKRGGSDPPEWIFFFLWAGSLKSS